MDSVRLLSVAWPFTAGGMLLWGLAAAIPILLHFWSQWRYREVTWAAMEFLIAALRKDARRVRIEQLLLLFVRVLILVLFALALADPVASLLSGSGLAGSGESPTHVVLVIDGSYSMDYRRDGESLFALAQEQAVQLTEQCAQGDAFTLILLADPPQAVVGQPVFDRAVIANEIRNLVLPHAGANLSATLSEVAELVAHVERRNPRLRQHRVCWFTDLGRNTWDAALDAEGRAKVAQLAKHARLELFDLSPPNPTNAAIVRLGIRESLVTTGRSFVCEAEAQNFSGRDVRPLRIEFRMDGQPVAERPVELAAGGRAVVSIVHTFESPGEHSVEAVLHDDPLTIDNHRWLSVPVRDSIPVLCVQGQPDEARYLALALDPTRSDRPRVRPEIAPETALIEQDLTPYDAVFLCNVGRIGPDDAAVLQRYVRQGGGLVIFLGDQVQAENYNQELGNSATGRRILPAELRAIRSGSQFPFATPDYRHPLVAPFRNQPRAGLLTTPVWKYFELHVGDREQVQIPWSFENGDPVIVDEPHGRGRCILFATAVSLASVDRTVQPPTPWTALPSWPSFVPLMQETLAHAMSGRAAARNALVGESLQAVLRSEDASVTVSVAGPAEADGSFREGERVRPLSAGDEIRWTFANAQRSGLYRAQYGPPLDAQQLFAVNVDTRESQLEHLDPESLPAEFQRTPRKESPAAVAALLGAGRRPLFRHLLGAVLVLLLVETGLAWYFGNRA